MIKKPAATKAKANAPKRVGPSIAPKTNGKARPAVSNKLAYFFKQKPVIAALVILIIGLSIGSYFIHQHLTKLKNTCSPFHSLLGRSYDLSKKSLAKDEFIDGYEFLNDVSGCYQYNWLKTLSYQSDQMESMTALSKSFESETSVSGNYGMFAASTSVGVAQNDERFRNFKAFIVDARQYYAQVSLNQRCIDGSPVSPGVLQQFFDLPVTLDGTSQVAYEAFLNKIGSHFVSGVKIGARAQAWTYSTSSGQTSTDALKVKACAQFNALVSSIQGCSGFEKSTTQSNTEMAITQKYFIRGGEKDLRGKLTSNFDADLVQQFLLTGEDNPGAVAYEFKETLDFMMPAIRKDSRYNATEVAVRQNELSNLIRLRTKQ